MKGVKRALLALAIAAGLSLPAAAQYQTVITTGTQNVKGRKTFSDFLVGSGLSCFGGSCFDAAGNLVLTPTKSLTLSGSGGTVVSGSSITTSGGFFGASAAITGGGISVTNSGDITDTLGFFDAQATGKILYRLNTSGTGFGTISNDADGVWCLGYNASSTHNLGTPTACWNKTGGFGVGPTVIASSVAVQVNAGHLVVGGDKYVISNSSVTTSGGFFGDGSHLTGVATSGGTSTGTVDGRMDDFTTQANGVTQSFSLSLVPTSSTSIHIYQNGLALRLGGDWTFVGPQTVKITTAPPTGVNSLFATYLVNTSTQPTPVYGLGWQTDYFLHQVTGAQKTFTLSMAPSTTTITVVLDGLLQSGASDYTFTPPNTVTMTTAPAANSSAFWVTYTVNSSTLTAAAIQNAPNAFTAANTFSGQTTLGTGTTWASATSTTAVLGIANFEIMVASADVSNVSTVTINSVVLESSVSYHATILGVSGTAMYWTMHFNGDVSSNTYSESCVISRGSGNAAVYHNGNAWALTLAGDTITGYKQPVNDPVRSDIWFSTSYGYNGTQIHGRLITVWGAESDTPTYDVSLLNCAFKYKGMLPIASLGISGSSALTTSQPNQPGQFRDVHWELYRGQRYK